MYTKTKVSNNGNNAILCSKCRKILAEGLDISIENWNEPNRWWCVNCTPDSIKVQKIFIKNKFIANKEIKRVYFIGGFRLINQSDVKKIKKVIITKINDDDEG